MLHSIVFIYNIYTLFNHFLIIGCKCCFLKKLLITSVNVFIHMDFSPFEFTYFLNSKIHIFLPLLYIRVHFGIR